MVYQSKDKDHTQEDAAKNVRGEKAIIEGEFWCNRDFLLVMSLTARMNDLYNV